MRNAMLTHRSHRVFMVIALPIDAVGYRIDITVSANAPKMFRNKRLLSRHTDAHGDIQKDHST
jgi:hypothetical protein